MDIHNRTRRGGAVLVMALLGMTLLVAMILYVYNVGDRVNDRVSRGPVQPRRDISTKRLLAAQRLRLIEVF